MQKAILITMSAIAATTTPAFAGEVELKPLIDARLRYENVDQAGVAVEADALTLRMRAGIEAKKGRLLSWLKAKRRSPLSRITTAA